MKKTKKAFTLIEILIVVILLGVLAAVVIPNLTSSADKTRKTAEAANCKQIQAAAARYYLEKSTDPTVDLLVKDGYLDTAPKSAIDPTKGFTITTAKNATTGVVTVTVTSASDTTIKYPPTSSNN